MTYTITVQQLNAVFGLVMPLIVGFIAGVIRQDGFATWLNELISHLVIVILAAAQTLLGGQWGGSGIANFVIVVSVAYGVLSTRFGSEFQGKVQTSTSIFKAPPAPPALTLEQITTVMSHLLQQYTLPQPGTSQRVTPIDAQPTTQMPAITRTNTPPLGG